MEQSILNRLENVKLMDEEVVGIQVNSADIQTSTEECQRSLIGQIHGDKVANFSGLKNTLSLLWKSIGAFQIRELGVNLYQFVFSSPSAQLKILAGKTWTFNSQFLIL